MPVVDLLLQGWKLDTDQGSTAFCGVTLIRSTKTILVDVAHTGRRLLLLEALKRRGLSPGDVDLVVLTHAHWDHMLNVDLFPNAELVISAAERRYAARPASDDWATPTYAGAILERMRVHEVSEGDEIDAGVRLLETPGHSPGSMVVTVEDEAGRIGIAGDALPTARAAIEGVPYLVFHDEQLARESVRKIAAHCAVVYPGHDRPFRLDGGAPAYLGPAEIRVWTQLHPQAEALAVRFSSEDGVTVEPGMGAAATR